MTEKMDPRRFLETSARMDDLVEHKDNCGHCGHQIIMAETARDFLAAGNLDINAYLTETRRRWEDGKYFKAYQEARRLGRNPAEYFEEKGLGEP